MSPKRSEEHTSELQSHSDLVCRLLLEKKKRGRKRKRAAPVLIVPTSGPSSMLTQNCLRKRANSRNLYRRFRCVSVSFFFNDTSTTEINTLSLHDALPI